MCSPFFDLCIQLCPFNPSYLVPNHFQLPDDMVCKCCKFDTKGTFHSTQNSGNFAWYIKWNRPFQFGLTGIFGTSFVGGPLWLVWSFWSGGPKSPFPFDKIVVPSAAVLYPVSLVTLLTSSVLSLSGIIRTDNLCWFYYLPRNQKWSKH